MSTRVKVVLEIRRFSYLLSANYQNVVAYFVLKRVKLYFLVEKVKDLHIFVLYDQRIALNGPENVRTELPVALI